MRSWKPHAGKVRVMTFSPDGATLATAGGTSKHVWLWDPPTGELRGKLDVGQAPIFAAEFAPVGRHLASLDNLGRVTVWALDPLGTGPVSEFDSGDSSARWLAFAPSGTRLVLGCPERLRWWDHPADAPAPRPHGSGVTFRGAGSARVSSVRFTPDGSLLLVGSADLELWPPDLGGAVGFVRTAKRNGIRAISVSRDGARAAVVISNTVRLCLLAERKFERTLWWGGDMVYATAFTPDGRTLLTAGADGSVRFWDVGTGHETRRFDWGIGKVSAAAFAPDGLTAAAGGERGGIVVWDVDG